jgi:hypothetical protein
MNKNINGKIMTIWYNLDMKCPLKAHVSKVWFQAGGASERQLDHEGANFINGLVNSRFHP